MAEDKKPWEVEYDKGGSDSKSATTEAKPWEVEYDKPATKKEDAPVNSNEEAQKKLQGNGKLPGLQDNKTPGKESNEAVPAHPQNERLPDPIKKKIGDKSVETYVAEKNHEQFKKQGEMSDIAGKLNQFQYSDNWKQFLNLSESFPKLKKGTPEYDAAVKKHDELMDKPFDYNSVQYEWGSNPTPASTSEKNYVKPATETTFKNTVPKEFAGVKTVGDAVKVWNKLSVDGRKLQDEHKAVTADKDETVKAARDIAGIKINQAGEHEINQYESFVDGLVGSFGAIKKTTDLLTSSPEERAQIGMQGEGEQLIDPKVPTGFGAGAFQAAGSLIPLAMPGIGAEAAFGKGLLAAGGAMFGQGLIMHMTGYAPAWQEMFSKTFNETGDKQLAVDKADKTAAVHGTVDFIVGAAMLPIATKLGGIAGKAILGEEAANYLTKTGELNASRMPLGRWVEYQLAHHSVASSPFYAGKVITNAFDIASGEKKGYLDGAADQYTGAMLLGFGMDGFMYGKGKVRDMWGKTLSKYAPDAAVQFINKMIGEGKMGQKEGTDMVGTIESQSRAYKMMPDGITIDHEAEILPILMENDQLMRQKKEGDIYPDVVTMDKIRKNNQKILEITQSPLSYDELKDRAKLKEQEKSNGGRLPQHDRDMLSHYDRRLDAIEATKADMANRKQKAIDDMIDKLSTGDKVDTTPEEQQFYEENKTAIDKGLEDKQTAIDTEKKASIQNKINAGEEITGDDLADKKKFEEDGYEFRPKPAAPPAPTPAPEEVQQHLESNYKKDLDAVHEKVFSGEMTPTEARAEIDKLKDKAAKDLADKKAAENKANRESLEPDMNAFSEYEALQKKKGIKKTNGVSDFLEKMGRRGAAIKAISDNWNDLRNELEKAGIVEIDCP